ncbi:snoRNA-binding rRNA-processing protein utp10 [Malassezia yamatoensis]|uniref:U3 small nucleolar RNA-associated protein 10 n=1 Tax=Malassezia yamatoensis TaxID=253288 RepID=A0AAJ5YSU8_9BASI|nr:snoRNA-binding rRNA-processing protein utp10 [Malassezia yamatoensis]
MTSLATQLAGIAAQRVSRQDPNSALRHRDSYLFTARVAAEQDYATVHALALSGWEQLVSEDASLDSFAFADLLFGDDSIRMDREALPASDNDQLNKACETLLYIISPVLLSRSAAKCLEWLVRRFSVHEHCPLALFRVFLPYHTTPQFTRVVQLLPVNRVPALQFLQPVKKAQTPLPTSLLLRAMSTNDDVLRLVAQTKPPTDIDLRYFPVTFWTAILVQFCWQDTRSNSRRKVDHRAQEILSILLPSILRLLARPLHQEAAIGAFMVLCSIGTAFHLSPKAVQGIMEAITGIVDTSSSLSAALARSLVACCFALCASPEQVQDPFQDATLLSDTALRSLLKLPEIAAQIDRAVREHDVDRFLAQLLAKLVQTLELEEARDLLDKLLRMSIAPLHRQETCQALFSGLSAWDCRVEILASVRQRSPAEFEKALEITRGQDETVAWSMLRAILQYDVTGQSSKNAPDSPTNALWLGLHSGDQAERAMTLKELLNAVKLNTIRAQDPLVADAVRNAFASPSVPLLETMYDSSDALLQALPSNEILDAIALRLTSDEVPLKEYKLHARFTIERLVPSSHSLDLDVWEKVVWPYLLRFKYAEYAVTRLAKSTGMLRDYAKSFDNSITEPKAWIRHTVQVIVDKFRASTDQTSDANFLLNGTRLPIAQGGALAWLVLNEVFEQGVMDPSSLYLTVASGVLRSVEQQGLLSGKAVNCDTGMDKEKLCALFVEKNSRRDFPCVCLCTVASLLRRLPIPADARIFTSVQQQATDEARLVWQAFRLLHMPNTADWAREQLLPVLFQRLGKILLSVLAGIWCMECNLDNSPVPYSDVAQRTICTRYALQLFDRAAMQHIPLDVQTLLPSILGLLQDQNQVLREAGTQLVRGLDRMHKAEQGTPTEIYGYDTIYGQASGPLQYLDHATLQRYVSILAENGSSYVNDVDGVASVHATMLAGTKKEQVSFNNRVICYILSHAVAWPSITAASYLLQAVHRVRASCKLPTITPLLEHAVNSKRQEPKAYLQLLFATYDARSLTDMTWALYLRALRSTGNLQRAALDVLSSSLLPSLSVERQQSVIMTLAQTVANPGPDAKDAASLALRTVPVQEGVLVGVLQQLLTSLGSTDEQPTQRIQAQEEDQVRKDAVVLITVLESMQSRPLQVQADLVASLFYVVRMAISMHATVLFNAEYVLQLAMQILCTMFEQSSSMPSDVAQAIRADTIVHAIKISTNTQSINHAILLLTRFARLDPELVLHNIMPLFTFVGLTVLRRDDRFTLSVVEQTLRSIIPAFVKHIRPQVEHAPDTRLALWLATRSLLRIFSDAASHIPRHRRAVFFSLLVDVLGNNDFLAPVSMLLAERVAHRVGKAPQNAASCLELPLGLLRSEPGEVRVNALNQIWPEAQRLYMGQDAFLDPTPKRASSEEHYAPSKWAFTLLCLILHALPTSPIPNMDQCAWFAFCTQPTDAPGEQILTQIRSAAVRHLPDDAFLHVVLPLLQGKRSAAPLVGSIPPHIEPSEVQKMGLGVLEVRSVHQHADEIHDALLHIWQHHQSDALGAHALSVLQRSVERSTAVTSNTRLAALLPLLLSANDPVQVLPLLARLVSQIGVKSLAHLNALVLIATETTKRRPAEEVSAGLHLLTALFRALPQFMHSYVDQAVYILSDPHVQSLQRARAPTMRASHRHLQDVVVKQMPFATVLSAVQKAWGNSDSVHLLHVLDQAVRVMSRSSVQSQYRPLYRFLLQAMALQQEAQVGEPVRPAPQAAIQVFLALVLKLSESQFRPLFLRTYDWAAVDLLEESDSVDADASYARLVVFYTWLHTLLTRLRGVMVSYFHVVYPNALQTLEHCANSSSSCTSPLWYAMVNCITLCAEVDEGNFWDTSRATKLVQPLLRALPRISAEDTVAPDTIAKAMLVVAETVPDDSFLRHLNTTLMSYAQSKNVPIRVHALNIASQIWAAHGANLLGFVPETVAQLAEFLEEIDPRASEAALQLRREIEAALGEPLDSYLE